MNKSTAPRRLGRVVLVQEVEIPRDGPIEWVRVTVAIPGREGTSSKVWTTHEGRLDDPTWLDLVAHVESTLSDLLLLIGGAQTRLPT